jgi:hypothetical protein
MTILPVYSQSFQKAPLSVSGPLQRVPHFSMGRRPVDAAQAKLIQNADIPLEEWLKQFKTPQDRAMAEKLFNNMLYLDIKDMRTGAKELHTWLTKEEGIDPECTGFVALGKGKSGDLFRYFYRQVNELKEKNMVSPDQLYQLEPNRRYKTLVLLDDFIGKGVSAMLYMKPYRAILAQYQQIYLLSLVGFKDGKELIETYYPNLKIKFWKEPKALQDPTNPQFTDNDRRQLPDFLEKYGRPLCYPKAEREHQKVTPYGYENAGALVAFFFNTPNNAPPIFWSNSNGWKPIFPRYGGINPAPSFAGYYTRVVAPGVA